MNMEKEAAAIRAKDNERLAERYRKERHEAGRTLYYTHKRNKGSKWATAEVFAIIDGALEHIATARYQPGASRGTHGEIIEAAKRSGRIAETEREEYRTREIEPGL